MTMNDILNLIAEALNDSDEQALFDIKQRLADYLMTADEGQALDNLIDAAIESIGREAA